jgi:hypothetical protein
VESIHIYFYNLSPHYARVFLLVGTIFGNAVIDENLLIFGDQDVVITGGQL